MRCSPRSDVGAGPESTSSTELLRLWQHRLALGVQGVFVDSHSQVAQFLRELHVATFTGTTNYAQSSNRHGARLRGWWANWSEGLEENFESRQAGDHELLLAALPEIKQMLDSGNERIKIEI